MRAANQAFLSPECLSIVPQEDSMKSNQRMAKLGAALLTLITLTLLLPGVALAQSKLKTLHRFTIPNGGNHPHAGVIFDQSGNLYGTTYYGGHRDSGTVFKLAPNTNGSWTETVLYTFCTLSQCADGALPQAGLVFDQAGNLYGTTSEGGEPSGGVGVVFKLTPNKDGSWSENVIYTFTGQKDGGFPEAGLIFDAKGNLYGTAAAGGTFSAINCVGDSGCGVVFELTPNTGGTWTESVLYRFPGDKDGYQPSAG
jgi:uncharacterized repeat protein (TIGR03803 family)